ncbi:MAG: tyrosine-type recombinase/integrase [Mycobacterium sp.]
MKRGTRTGVEDRWHRSPRRGELVHWPADDASPGAWCIDTKHGQPGTLVTTTRHGQGRRYLARWVDNDGNERSKSFDRKGEAQHHIGNVRTALNTGTYADPKRGAVAFRTVAEEWIDGKRIALADKTLAGYQSLLDVTVLPKWGDIPLRDIDHAGIQQWVTWLSVSPDARHRPVKRDDDDNDDDTPQGLSAARVIQAFQVVDQVLAYAIRARYIAINPADGVHLPRKSSREDKALTHEHVRALAEAAGELSTVVYVLGYGGLRYGELAALRANAVDVQRRRLRVSRSITYVRGVGHKEGPTKTHQARDVPLPQFVMDRVAEAIRCRDGDEFVFPGPNGEAMPLDYFRWRFDKACVGAGLDEVTPKTLRHTAGSLALKSGALVVTVSKLLGHRNVTTTMNIYAHDLPDDFDTLSDAMDSAIQAAAASG